MAYQLEVQETFSEGVKRILAEELGGALTGLRGEATGDATVHNTAHNAVHDARKRFKKLRAALRLVKSDLGGKRYRQADVLFRDAGRALAGLRDAEVLLATLEALVAQVDAKAHRKTFNRARKVLSARQQLVAAQADVLTEGVAAKVAAVQEQITSWPLGDAWRSAAPNVKDSYKQGLKTFGQAYRHPSDDSFHEWRKRVKDLWYQLRILNPLWPEVMVELAAQAGKLADLLGEEHDLAVLAQTLADDPAFGAPAEVEGLLELIEGRRVALRTEAEALGRRLYADKPKVFVRRFGAYWQVWRSRDG